MWFKKVETIKYVIIIALSFFYIFACVQIVAPSSSTLHLLNFREPLNYASLTIPSSIDCPDTVTIKQGEIKTFKLNFIGEGDVSNKYGIDYPLDSPTIDLDVDSYFDIKIYGLSVGEESFTVFSRLDENVSKDVLVKVIPNIEEQISMCSFNLTSTDSISIGESGNILVDVEPYYASFNLVFDSSNLDVIDLDSNGHYFAKSVGISVVSCTVNEKYYFEKTITVVQNENNKDIESLDKPLNFTSGNKYSLKEIIGNNLNVAFNATIENIDGKASIYGNSMVARRPGEVILKLYSIVTGDCIFEKNISIIPRDYAVKPTIYFTYGSPRKIEHNYIVSAQNDAATKINVLCNDGSICDPMFINRLSLNVTDNSFVIVDNECGFIYSKSNYNQRALVDIVYTFNGEEIKQTLKINFYTVYDNGYANRFFLNTFVYFIFIPLSFFLYSFVLWRLFIDKKVIIKSIVSLALIAVPFVLSILFHTFVMQDFLVAFISSLFGIVTAIILYKVRKNKVILSDIYEISI